MSKSYALMTEGERWNWHSEVYAFRRVVLGASPDEKTSPPDPEGVYFNEDLVRAAARRLVDKRNKGRRAWQRARHDDLQREGRGTVDAWARSQGFADLDHYAQAKGIADITDAYRVYLASPEFARFVDREKARRIGVPEEAEPDYAAVQEILGIAAKEERQAKAFNPTKEQLSQARTELGMEE